MKNAKTHAICAIFMVGTISALVLSVIALVISAAGRDNSVTPYNTDCSCSSGVSQADSSNEVSESSEVQSNENSSSRCLMELPSLDTNTKLFTDYRAYDLWWTPHYRLQQAAWTDKQGLRRFNDDYIVGLGSFYSTRIGDRFKITLDSGRDFTVIFGDGKADCDTDSRNMYTPCRNYNDEDVANVLEFIVDTDTLPKKVYQYGSIEILDGFDGNIIEMEYLGRDNSQDWDTYETM